MVRAILLVSLVSVLMIVAAYPVKCQTISVFDTVFTPEGYSSGQLLATMFVPAVSNGIGVVFVHGSGGGRGSQRPWCDTLAAYGYVGMSIDYAEGSTWPEEPRTAKIAVEFLRRNASRFGITTDRIVGWGMSRGAWIWGQAVPWDNADSLFNTDPGINDHLDAAILLYGFYQDYCLPYFENITTPLLLMHGTADVVGPYEQSVLLYDSLVAHQKPAQLLLFEGAPHAFDLNYPLATAFTLTGLVAKDSALAFLRRTVNPALKIRVSSTTIDCGNVIALSSDTFAVAVDNIGSSDLRIDSAVTRSPGYSLIDLPLFPATMAPRSSLQFRVVFHPPATGAYNDTIDLASDDPLHPVVNIALRGRGVAGITRAHTGVLYASGPGDPHGFLYSITPASGAMWTIGGLGVPELRGLTVRPSTGELYGAVTSASASILYRVNPDSGYAVRMSSIPAGNLRGLAFSNGDRLYGVTADGILCRIDPATGDTSLVGRAPALAYSGIAFNPTDGVLWASVRTPIDSIFTVDTVTGDAAFVGTTGFNALTTSLTFDPSGRLLALIDNGSGEDYLAEIDTQTGAGTLLSDYPLSQHYLTAIAMSPDTTVTSVHNVSGREVPRTISLGQNYPNPFNPWTTIKFWMPTSQRVSVKVFDLLGRELTTLASGVVPAGEHTVRWDASQVPSGVYFYRLIAGPFSQTRKMVRAN